MSLDNLANEIISLIDRERLKQTTYEFVKIQSPTGEEGEFLEFYGKYLEDIGIDVQWDHEIPHVPSVVARIEGKSEKPVFQFDGHGDTIPTGSALPDMKGDIIYGRGACDMKAGLAAMAETARIIKKSGIQPNGRLLLTAHGGEESPIGRSNELKSLLSKGIYGDVCIIPEPEKNILPIFCKGMCNFHISINRTGQSIHEIEGGKDTPNPNLIAHQLMDLMIKKVDSLSNLRHILLGVESVFFGIITGGDFFNRIPTTCKLSGTRRYLPGKKFKDVEEEFQEYLERLNPPDNVTIDLNLINSSEPYELSPDEKIVRSVNTAHKTVAGKELPMGGVKFVGEAGLFMNQVKVPTIYHGVDGRTIHSDEEFVEVDDIVRLVKVFVHTIFNYFGTE